MMKSKLAENALIRQRLEMLAGTLVGVENTLDNLRQTVYEMDSDLFSGLSSTLMRMADNIANQQRFIHEALENMKDG